MIDYHCCMLKEIHMIALVSAAALGVQKTKESLSISVIFSISPS